MGKTYNVDYPKILNRKWKGNRRSSTKERGCNPFAPVDPLMFSQTSGREVYRKGQQSIWNMPTRRPSFLWLTLFRQHEWNIFNESIHNVTRTCYSSFFKVYLPQSPGWKCQFFEGFVLKTYCGAIPFRRHRPRTKPWVWVWSHCLECYKGSVHWGQIQWKIH